MSDHDAPGRDLDEHLAKDAGLPGGDGAAPGDDTESHLSEDAAVPAEAVAADPEPEVPASFATGGFVTPGRE